MYQKFMNFMSNKLMPIATKVGSQKHLVALRDSFIATMPVVMTGSIALLINAFFVDFPSQFGWDGITQTFQWLVNINNLIYNGSLAIVSIVFIFALGYNIAKVYSVDKLSGGLVALASFIISLGTSMTQSFELSGISNSVAKAINQISGLSFSKGTLSVTIGGLIPGNQVSSRGYFTAIIIGFLSVIIFAKLMKKDITIKLPDSVPPAIAVPFTSIIPAFVAMYVVAIITFVFNQFTGKLIIDWIYDVLQTPLLGFSQNPISVIAVAFLTQLFWFFGIHGGNVMAPIMEGVFGVALLANLEAFQKGAKIPYLWTSVSYGAFVWYATLGLLIAIFWQSKNKHYREVAKLGIAPCLFNIGEPVMYGLPTVLNPILFIPFLLCPVVMSGVAYGATALGLVAPVTQNVAWVMPPVLYGFFGTAFDWRSIILSLVNLALAVIIYLPFVKLANNPEFEKNEG
mgnify:FL=1